MRYSASYCVHPGVFPYGVSIVECMGFGSYDESEQKDQNVEADEDAAVNVHENDHEGEVEFEFEESEESLIDKLQDMKGDDEE
jgi:hypothetical protein